MECFVRYRQPRRGECMVLCKLGGVRLICSYTSEESSVSTEHGREYTTYLRIIRLTCRPPSINSTTGDIIRIHATNGLGTEGLGTALHAHGMMFNNSNWFDGAVGVTQCPIPPGETLTYDIDTSIQVRGFSIPPTIHADGRLVLSGSTVTTRVNTSTV